MKYEDLLKAQEELDALGLDESPDTFYVSQSLLDKTGMTPEEMLAAIDAIK
jgi:hypothetical protein